MNNLHILFPEIFLSLSIMTILMVGVFIKNSYKIVNRLCLIVLIILIFIIFNSTDLNLKVFSESFTKDKFSDYIKTLILLSSIFILTSTQSFINNIKISKFEYPILVLLSILGMFFMVSANDIILFYLGLELQSLALYILATIDRASIKSTESGIKYFVLSALSSGLLLYGCSLLYGFTGSTNFDLIQNELAGDNIGALFATVFIIVGLAFKVSAVPFHMWTPDVYEGSPTSVTNFFAVVPKIAGIAVIIRFMDIPFKMILSEWQLIIIFLSIASMILGAVAAIGQKNIKRLLAYSSIGHIGYILAGISTGDTDGYSSSLIYLTIYVVMNLGAFSCLYFMKINSVYTEKIEDLSGLSKNNPILAFSFLIIFFSLAGIPPLGGFFAKFYVFIAVIESELYYLAIVGLVTTVVSAFYYLKIIKVIYFDENKIQFDKVNDFNSSVVMIISCIFLGTLFLYPSLFNGIINSIF
ncbi:MAG: NADH-quinone oxidoreductase subunit NuoN [Candidatus Pelagibacter sp.]|nr:NADH-quinone oxidoreductase subunit NuoN [Candidatus Pelagibacter sp.]OUW23495.1 MAG: NADH-quinone oxidoreductase subunit N [Rickettsiales bacterium TMED174]